MPDIKPNEIQIIKRSGNTVAFEPEKIRIALTKAFIASTDLPTLPESSHDKIDNLVLKIEDVFKRRLPSGGVLHIEEVQDQVELQLMRSGEQVVSRHYVLYREERAKERAKNATAQAAPSLQITNGQGELEPLDVAKIEKTIKSSSHGLNNINISAVVTETVKNLYNGVKSSDILTTILMAARTRIESEPEYSFLTARILATQHQKEANKFLGFESNDPENKTFSSYIRKAVELELLDPALEKFDLELLAQALKPIKTEKFTYLGYQTLYDRYFVKSDEVRFELAQSFFMRVAMGLALNEDDINARAIEFYELLSDLHYMASTPTLFNAGSLHPQLSSCYLTTIADDLYEIYGSMRDDAMLSKWAGGIGNDWTSVRALNSRIKGTNGKSQGVVPFLKVANDTAVAVNQGGKRKGAICAYLETFHLDVEEFLELRKNTGDDRRRTHDMNTANWIPDLFMIRVFSGGNWTLFTPSEVPDLHDLYGNEFKERYEYYESVAKEKGMLHKVVKAQDLWRKMLSMLFETGHPWFTFKDPCNIRSPQGHVGVVHSSNLCTEITLNTSADEIAVCNLGSINLVEHIFEGKLDHEKLKKTINTAVRMLDNVIDINFYPVPQAERSNKLHRPVGLGIMGFQDALYKLNIAFDSQEAVEFADKSMEVISYYAILASTELAKERGSYSSYEGSHWSKGRVPLDSIALLKASRPEGYLEQDSSSTLDWDYVREQVKTVGMRNSNVMAIAPTATIANICGVSQSIEPTFQNLYVKSNLSGEFTVINPYLVDALKKEGLWDAVMINDLKHYEGSVSKIKRVPDHIKAIFKTAFEVEPRWLVDAASRRQKWIDQAQSLNLYIAEANGRKLDMTYRMAWLRGLKTTYYLRAIGATSVEKSTTTAGALNAVANSTAAPIPAPVVEANDEPDFENAAQFKSCSILDGDCESCQ